MPTAMFAPMLKRVLVTILFVLAFPVLADPSIIIVKGRVFTGDASRPFAEALAIEGNQIVAVGTDREIKARAGEKTKVIDAQGRLIIPGINDAHTHPGATPPSSGFASDLSASWPDIAASLAAMVDETAADLWLIGTMGPGVVNDRTITSATLDKLAPGRKVMLSSFTGHGTVLSSAAMKFLGLGPDSKDPAGGWLERDADGKANGRLHEYAEYAARRRLADSASEEEVIASIQAFSDDALQYGITSVQAMPFVSEDRFAAAVAKAGVPLRVRIMALQMPDDPKIPKSASALKWILDGTPVEGGAALRTAKYRDGSQGRENFRDLAPLAQKAVDSKLPLLVHASGDRAVASALQMFARAGLQRPRLEHADGLQSDLIPLAKETGAVVVLNPSHFELRSFFPDGEYMLASTLLKAGIPIAFGSDGPINPFLNILMATARRDQPSQSLSRMDALRAYTSGSAFAEFAETRKGKLAPGMLADVAILSENILDAPAGSLPDVRSVLTIIDGKIVYER